MGAVPDHQRLVGFACEDVHVLPASDQGPANAVHAGRCVVVGSGIVLAQRDELSGGALVGRSEGLVPKVGGKQLDGVGTRLG